MKPLEQFEVWFVTGSQHLYGEQALRQVGEHASRVADALDVSEGMPVRVVFKPVATDPESIHRLCLEASAARQCVGLVVWMHTFSPAKMWISGLGVLRKPLLH